MVRIRRLVWLGVALWLAVPVVPTWADVVGPYPRTTWKRNQAPSDRSIVMAGLCLSAAVVAAGLLASRLPPLRQKPLVVGMVALAALLAVTGISFGVYQLAAGDRIAWQVWEESNGRRGGRTRPEFLDPPPILSPPTPAVQPPSP